MLTRTATSYVFRVRPARAQDSSQGAGRDAFVACLARLGLGREAPSLSICQTRRASFRTHSVRERRARAGRHARPVVARLRAKLLDEAGRPRVELNGLFSELLAKLGFAVRLLACRVLAGPERGGTGAWRAVPSHAAMAVRLDDGDHFVDVGLGEPPLGPIPSSGDGRTTRTAWSPDNGGRGRK